MPAKPNFDNQSQQSKSALMVIKETKDEEEQPDFGHRQDSQLSMIRPQEQTPIQVPSTGISTVYPEQP